jgi:polysaccharide export outer membrane protein
LGIDILRVGDKVTVTFSDIPTAYPPMERRISEDGTITLPLGVSVVAAGKKAGELESIIQNEYVPRYFVRLTVNAKPEERVIYVGGHVRAPGRYVYAGEMTVLKAVKVAGDFTDYANKRKVVLIRTNKTRIVIDCIKAQKYPKFDLPVYPGDEIHVPQRYI